jgi:hypothetical protein
LQLSAAAATDDEVELIWRESIVKTEAQIVELFEDSIEPIKRLVLTTVAIPWVAQVKQKHCR